MIPLPLDLSNIVTDYLSSLLIICRIGNKCYHKDVTNHQISIKKCDCSLYNPSMLDRKGEVKWFSYELIPNIFIGMYEPGSIHAVKRCARTINDDPITYIETELKRKLFPNHTLKINNIYDHIDLTQLPRIRHNSIPNQNYFIQ